MTVMFTKLPGLDEARLLEVVVPILRAHAVAGVELIWRTDQKGHVLELTIEKPDARLPGAGITVDLCSEISRDLSVALDVVDVIRSSNYRLEVGSPGLDRPLHTLDEYRRFAGQLAKLKLRAPLTQEGFAGQKVLRGNLFGVTDDGKVSVETERGTVAVPLDEVQSARLVFEWKAGGAASKGGAAKAKANRPAARNFPGGAHPRKARSK